MTDKYALNEKVFAKLKGFPPWPAKVKIIKFFQDSRKLKFE